MFINPEFFKVYKNGAIKLGEFQVYQYGYFYQLFIGYYKKIYGSSHNLIVEDSPFYTVWEKANYVSKVPYPEDVKQIEVKGQIFIINGYELKLSYASDYNPEHTLSKDGKEITSGSDLYKLYEIAFNS